MEFQALPRGAAVSWVLLWEYYLKLLPERIGSVGIWHLNPS